MDYFAINQYAWDKLTDIHVRSKHYDVDGFLRGTNNLSEIELAELGAVQGKSLLHLQCHFGLDTLSWARLGATVTGVDFSPVAIAKANELTSRANLQADFICSNIYQLPKPSGPLYDIVFTSYGALCWLPDLDRWARLIVDNLKPGGTFYMVEFHPVHELHSGFGYFPSPTPDVEDTGTYTENDDGNTHTMATWAHPLSEVINALIRAGIRIDHVNEFPFSPHDCFGGLVEKQPGRYFVDDCKNAIPLTYSIKGTRLS